LARLASSATNTLAAPKPVSSADAAFAPPPRSKIENDPPLPLATVSAKVMAECVVFLSLPSLNSATTKTLAMIRVPLASEM
jgi:hypothetical protein